VFLALLAPSTDERFEMSKRTDETVPAPDGGSTKMKMKSSATAPPAAEAIGIPPAVLVWQFGGRSGNLTAQNSYTLNSGYNMLCRTNSEYLTYGTQPTGINLDYTADASVRKTHFRLPDGQERPVLTGEPVALGIGGGDPFLYYAERITGINVKWAGDPRWEWRIFGPTGESGLPVPTGAPVALINVNVEPGPDFLVFLNRHPGTADIGWTTSPSWWGDIGVPLVSLVRKFVLS
jgi:hypothetical protein